MRVATAFPVQTRHSANHAAPQQHYGRSSSLCDILEELSSASPTIKALASLGGSPTLNYATKPQAAIDPNFCRFGHPPVGQNQRRLVLQQLASVHAKVDSQLDLVRHLVDRKTSKERRSAALARSRQTTALADDVKVRSQFGGRRVGTRLRPPRYTLSDRQAGVGGELQKLAYIYRQVQLKKVS